MSTPNGNGGQPIGPACIEKPILGQGARRDDTHHIAAHDGFVAALLGLCRVFHLFADRDLKAAADQLSQIGFRRMDRHAAHGDRFAAMATALGQRNTQGLRRLDRIVEEQLVEVAHAKEHQRVGLARFGVKILRHHRGGVGMDLGRGNHGGRSVHTRQTRGLWPRG